MRSLRGLTATALALLVIAAAACTENNSDAQWPEPLRTWVAQGEPVSDADVAPIFRPVPTLPGTAVRMASTDWGGSLGEVGFYMVMVPTTALDWPGEPPSTDPTSYCYSIYGFGGQGGMTACDPRGDRVVDALRFGAYLSGTCEPPVKNLLSVWGIPSTATALLVELDDGTELSVAPTNGIAQVAWDGERSIISIHFDGATEESMSRLSRLSDDEARIDCSQP